MDDTIRVLLPEEEIDRRIREMGSQISGYYGDDGVFLVCVLRGAVMFACELAKRITVPVTMDFIKTSSYGSGTLSSGDVKIDMDLGLSVEGRHVLIVEDIIDTGHTFHALYNLFQNRGAKSIKLCSLLDKPDRREVEVPVDFVGFSVPDAFVVGYGLDFDQKYRNLPYIGVI